MDLLEKEARSLQEELSRGRAPLSPRSPSPDEERNPLGRGQLGAWVGWSPRWRMEERGGKYRGLGVSLSKTPAGPRAGARVGSGGG